MVETVHNQNEMMESFLTQEEASEYLGLERNNRNSLYWWKRRIAPDVMFPKFGRRTQWPVDFLDEVKRVRYGGVSSGSEAQEG